MRIIRLASGRTPVRMTRLWRWCLATLVLLPLWVPTVWSFSSTNLASDPMSIRGKHTDEIVSKVVDYYTEEDKRDTDKAGTDDPGRRKRGTVQLASATETPYVAWKVMERVLSKEKAHTERPKLGLYVTRTRNGIDEALDQRDQHGILATFRDNDEAGVPQTMIVASRSNQSGVRCSTHLQDVADFLASPAPCQILVATYHSLPKIGSALDSLSAEKNERRTVDFAVFDATAQMFAYGLDDSNLDVRNRLFFTKTSRPSNEALLGPCLVSTPPRDSERKSRRSLWNHRFELLVRYKAREGHCNVRYYHKEDGVQLGIWLTTQRRRKTQGKLEEVREEKLTKLGVVWYEGVRTEEWIKLLEKYKEREGDCHVPLKHQEDGRNLGLWVNYLRTSKKEGTLDVSLEERLTDVGVVWNVFGQQWEGMFLLLQKYKEREGDCKVHYKHKEDGKNLGSWLRRQHISKEKGTLDVSLEERLTDVGVVWVVSGQRWEDMFMLLQKYKEREGDCKVPPNHKEDGKNLGTWLAYQREKVRKGTLNENAKERLADVGVVWDVFGQQWEDMFLLLQKYKEREGDCKVHYKHKEDGKNLGTWLQTQRQNKKKGTLDVSLEERLTDVGVVWVVSGQQWEAMFLLLQKYKEREGDCKVPPNHKEDGKSLGIWLSRQRMSKKKGTLDVSLEAKLTDVGVVWDVLGQQWEDMFLLLQKYKEREGDCKVPSRHKEEGKSLGRWLRHQYASEKRGTLDEDLGERLTELGVVWDTSVQKWENMYTLLLQYKDREGDCNVPFRYQEDGKTLGLWLAYQREKVKKGTLNENAKARLADIGVVWDVDAQQWEDMFLLLQRYKEREGDCNVPRYHQEQGENLGEWLIRQRTSKQRGTLDVGLEERLTAIGVAWDVLLEKRWKDMALLLEQYKEREGNSDGPS